MPPSPPTASKGVIMFDHMAEIIGYAVIAGGASAAAAFLVYLPINYAWRRFGDVFALVRIIREAKKQGRPVFKEKEPSHDNQ